MALTLIVASTLILSTDNQASKVRQLLDYDENIKISKILCSLIILFSIPLISIPLN